MASAPERAGRREPHEGQPSAASGVEPPQPVQRLSVMGQVSAELSLSLPAKLELCQCHRPLVQSAAPDVGVAAIKQQSAWRSECGRTSCRAGVSGGVERANSNGAPRTESKPNNTSLATLHGARLAKNSNGSGPIDGGAGRLA